ncbi:nucleotidyl transferase AbiEii/AbiGii toxin family protein [Streptomyces sp. NPDC058466]|uniref:nucleotidyl transferase AbiEii/AbiGii toxin family protein n=1 Tax=Streptomyces sp. NPDC058466 TaxID=3346512 RepID=UPI00365383E1
MPELHTRLLADVIALGAPYPLVLTGGYAIRAHRLVERPSQDLDVATENPAPMADIAAYLQCRPGSARLAGAVVGDRAVVGPLHRLRPGRRAGVRGRHPQGEFSRPIVQSPHGPVLAEEDVIGTKVRALGDRGAPRDLIDVFAASQRWTTADLEEFGRRHARGRFEQEDLQANLAGAEWTDDEAFTAYGIDETTISALRAWAVAWSDDLAARLHEQPDDAHDD